MGRQLKQYILVKNHQINYWASLSHALDFQNQLSHYLQILSGIMQLKIYF